MLEFGIEGPVISIVTGIHGNETSNLMVIHKLICELNKKPIKKGKLRIILSANPLAFIADKRKSINEEEDLNRSFPGSDNGSMTQKIAKNLLDLLKDSTCIIDLHSFHMQTPLMGLIVKSDDIELENRKLELMKKFSPELVWVIDFSKNKEIQFQKALGSALNELKIPNIAVELDDRDSILDSQVTSCTDGLLRVLHHFDMIEFSLSQKSFFLFDRQEIFCEVSGLFIPSCKPGDFLNQGDEVGRIIIFPELVEKRILSNLNGNVMQILKKKFVFQGIAVAAIGKKINEGE